MGRSHQQSVERLDSSEHEIALDDDYDDDTEIEQTRARIKSDLLNATATQGTMHCPTNTSKTNLIQHHEQ